MLWVILMEMKISHVRYSIFSISHLYCFSRDFCQKVYEETILFQLKFQKSISRCSILQKIRMSKFVILDGGPLNIRQKFEKCFHFWCFYFRNKKCWQFWIFHELNILVMISLCCSSVSFNSVNNFIKKHSAGLF